MYRLFLKTDCCQQVQVSRRLPLDRQKIVCQAERSYGLLLFGRAGELGRRLGSDPRTLGRIEPLQDFDDVVAIQGDATGGRVFRIEPNVEEDRAALTGIGGVYVV